MVALRRTPETGPSFFKGFSFICQYYSHNGARVADVTCNMGNHLRGSFEQALKDLSIDYSQDANGYRFSVEAQKKMQQLGILPVDHKPVMANPQKAEWDEPEYGPTDIHLRQQPDGSWQDGNPKALLEKGYWVVPIAAADAKQDAFVGYKATVRTGRNPRGADGVIACPEANQPQLIDALLKAGVEFRLVGRDAKIYEGIDRNHIVVAAKSIGTLQEHGAQIAMDQGAEYEATLRKYGVKLGWKTAHVQSLSQGAAANKGIVGL